MIQETTHTASIERPVRLRAPASDALRLIIEHRQRLAREIVLAESLRPIVSTDPDVHRRAESFRAHRRESLVLQYVEATDAEHRLVLVNREAP